MRDELLTLLLAGHETTTAALAWAFEALLRHDEALRRALAAREPGWAAAVAHEALRLRPPVPLIVRKLLAPLEVGGHELPAGTTVAPVGDPAAPPRPTSTPSRTTSAPSAGWTAQAGDVRVAAVRRQRAPLPGRELRA